MTFNAPKSYVLKWKARKLLRRLFPIQPKEADYFAPVGTQFNRILDDVARGEYKESIDVMFRLVPKMMERKIPEANVQQAFVLDTVRVFVQEKSSPRILCVGCYEDSAAESLERMGYRIDGVDPVLNYDLGGFCERYPKRRNHYDIVFSTSVIEHVEDDELFIRQIGSLLAPQGVAILTADFNDQYQPGDAIPQEDFHMYTQSDFNERLLPQVKDCALVDKPQWDCPEPDFVYAGYSYTFATLVFRKNSM